MTDWRRNAACLGEDPEVWFDPLTQDSAILTCQTCPVREQCLDDAMKAEAGQQSQRRFGIFGGYTNTERARMDNSVRQHGPPAGLARARALWAKGFTHAEVARELGLAKTTIDGWSTKHGRVAA